MTERVEPGFSRSPYELALELVNGLDAMVAYWDSNQVCLFANAAYRSWLGQDGADLVGARLQDSLGLLYLQNLPYIERVLGGEKQVFEHAIAGPAGRVRHSLVTYIPRVIDGKVEGFFAHVADVEPLKMLMEELRADKAAAERTATHDHLTGLPNRVLLPDKLAATLAQAVRRDEGFALITIDLDRFKQINDTFGHAEGDAFLVEMTKRIMGSIRESDALLRTGGDEFLLIATQTNTVEQASIFAEKVVQSVRRVYPIGDVVIRPSLSAGVAVYPDDGCTVAELLKVSDQALYAAKSSGRDCFSFIDTVQNRILHVGNVPEHDPFRMPHSAVNTSCESPSHM